ncbi:MAG: hypothetical protein A2020_03775 [Lentisphaerae bacterium GWF2_45_14]|nr:MAG: hypothetical protein A2020_03775 [Lentisphaerae bacterium GWF2_45_14]
MDCYEILGVDRTSDFQSLKKAYYRKVKECHPDLFNNSRVKEEEFKLLVSAFDILSDPERRADYDSSLGIEPELEIIAGQGDAPVNMNSIMDSPADDILEELVVGNNPPSGTSLATLLSDLERTQVFITFREAKTLYFYKKFSGSVALFLTAISLSPSNIIYRVYLARAYASLGSYSKAASQYQAALRIGEHRFPPQHLFNVRKELESLNNKRLPLWSRFLSLFKDKESNSLAAGSEEMIGETNRAIAKIISERKKKKTSDDTKKLPPG